MNTIPSPPLLPRRMKKATILYHYPCPDGAFAAIAAHLYFSSTSTPTLFFPNTVYSAVTTQLPPLQEIDRLCLLDFVGPAWFRPQRVREGPLGCGFGSSQDCIVDVKQRGLKLGGNVSKVIDMGRSGATMAYDYFKAKVAEDDRVCEFERVRRLFEHIEDGDLWRWRLDHSKAFSSGLKDLKLEFDVQLNPSLFNQAVDGDAISELRSELGYQLADKSGKLSLRGIGAVVYKVPELGNHELLIVSLRSLTGEDATPISQNFGRGGHWNAGSFGIRTKELDRSKAFQTD